MVSSDNVNLTNLQNISIDRSLPVETKIKDFVRQVANPYHYMVKDVAITAVFPNTAPPLEDGYRRLRA